MNRAARWKDANVWKPFGEVSHTEAARLFCEFFNVAGSVETKDLDEPAGCIYEHEVREVRAFKVKPLRGREANQ